MNTLVLSGGGAKGAYTAGVIYHLLEKQVAGEPFQLAIGTSTGALAAGPALLEDHRYLRNVYVGVDDSDIMQNSWLGKLVSLFVKGSVPIQASMEPLYQILKKYYIDDGKLEVLQQSGKTLIATSVNARTGKIEYVSSNEVGNSISAKTFIRSILASASVPLFTRPVKIYENEPGHKYQNDLFYDGGIKEFLPLQQAIRLGAEKIWAISNHPPRFNTTEWGGNTRPENVNFIKILKWLISSTLNEVERGDLFRALAFHRIGLARTELQSLSSTKGWDKKTTQQLLKIIDDIFPFIPDKLKELHVITPSRPMAASLEFDPEVMLGYFTDGILTARSYRNNLHNSSGHADINEFINCKLI